MDVYCTHYENLSFEGTDLDSPIDRVSDTLRLDFARLRIFCSFEKNSIILPPSSAPRVRRDLRARKLNDRPDRSSCQVAYWV